MQVQKNNAVSKNIFGPYILKMRVIPGRETSRNTKELEKKLFQIVDEYVEEA